MGEYAAEPGEAADTGVSGGEPRLPIAREGWRLIGGAALLTGIAALAGPPWLSGGLLVLTALVTNFFRDPRRTPPPDPRSIVAPADGRVVRAEPVEDARFLHGPAQQVSIFMSPLDVHVNRNPVSGRVRDVRYHTGRYFRAFADKASLDNEQNAVVLEDAAGRTVAFVQIAGFLARRIVCYLRVGMPVARGQRCGIIMFGSRVDVFLPPTARVCVEVGRRTRAGETVIAEWTS
jgi:phosphatidylserine decarboxylase